MVNGFAHTALYTTKFEETLDFYGKAFGATKNGYPHTPRKSCLLKIGKDVLEVFEIPEENKLETGLFKHLAISCTNVDELFEKAVSLGAKPYVEPNDITVSSFDEQGNEIEKKVRMAFVLGPSGEQLELMGE